ncbi:MAG: ATP-dependent Clp protease adaptor ClpS [Spirochaetota bacterium]
MLRIWNSVTQEDTETEIRYDTKDVYGSGVMLYNDNFNTFEHVEDCLRRICYKSLEEAQRIAMEAHSKGKSLCYKGSMEECETVWEKMSIEGLTVSLVS